MILCLLIMQLSLAMVPDGYFFTGSEIDERNDGLPSNSIIDIETLAGFNSDYIFLSSSNGLGYSYESGGNFVFRELEDDLLPEGGNPAMVVNDNIIAVSGSVTVLDAGGYYPAGTGVSGKVILTGLSIKLLAKFSDTNEIISEAIPPIGQS